ncbi:hypothetical protein DKX38_010821 [Salix brachista]|uniref:Gamma-glutamylcyclotransferase n=1 Tax=Salix brachista TaxID=2182728 RepID=A0A5N5MEF2_9ROSI|nr:hypothetical protein DKX38_010821 [Salix brachista]
MVFWVFGYGSLVWNPGFEYDEKVTGFIKDYRRVFDLACIDHRGTPESPARTCTLEYVEGAICWGAAYCVRGGPKREKLAMEEGEPSEPALTGVIVFTSTPDKVSNKYYLGPAALEEMARQIATAHGPCGNNRDYLFSLEKAMFAIGKVFSLFFTLIIHNELTILSHEDDMVIELANEVRKVLGTTGNGIPVEKKITGSSPVALKSHMPALKLRSLQEAVMMDS